ncbi:MAG: hypothetical protein EAX86_07180 [Candidatus Heimdallarchaeota archaeon]|nr:hypothetical protein [Candidatus Heimdallarchaeota archaeon]
MTVEAPESEIFAIGIGECGSNLVGSYLAKSKKGELPPRIREYLVMNTDRGDLLKARKKYSISKKRTLLYSDAEIGVGGKFSAGYDAVMNSQDIILNQLQGLGYEGISGFCIFTSFGGGTGCGGTPALIRLLRERFAKEEKRKIFIYVFGVLPFDNQSSEAVNSIWALSRLLRLQLEEGNMGPDLILLLSNRTMLNRVLSMQRGESVDLLSKTGLDLADVSAEVRRTSTPNVLGQVSTDLPVKMEEEFVELINPLALDCIAEMLSPGVPEIGKEVLPTTDIGDFALKLDSVVVPAMYDDLSIFPEIGGVGSQLSTAVEYTAANCSLTYMGTNPGASSVFSVLSGPKDIARVEFDPLLKKALTPFLAKGASISPTYCAFDDDKIKSSLLLLFGLPKVPELYNLLEEAKSLIELHSGDSELKQHWFKRSKGTTQAELQNAVQDLEKLFGYYMKPEQK